MASVCDIDRESLVVDHLPIAKWLAYKRSRETGYDQDDLLGAAHLGLVQAAARFDPGLGVKFGTYASLRMLGAMGDEMRAADPVGRDDRQLHRKIDDARSKLTAQEGRNPTELELAASAEIGVLKLRRVERRVHNAYPVPLGGRALPWFSPLAGDEASGELEHDTCADPRAEQEFDSVIDEGNPELTEALQHLSERERHVLDRRFREDWTLARIGSELGVTESRVSQIVTKALARLRHDLAAAA